MAISGSLNFITSSKFAIISDGGSPIFGDDESAENGLDGVLYNFDFVGLNVGINEPISSSANTLGYPADVDVAEYINNKKPGGTYLVEELTSDHRAKVLNPLLHHRNGPYQHPSWKQIRGGNHPIARLHRSQNTMSIDFSQPRKKVVSYDFDENYPQPPEALNHVLIVSRSNGKTHPSLRHFYEPAVISHHKPMSYRIGAMTFRQPVHNEISYFSNQILNEKLDVSDGDINTTSSYKDKEIYYRTLHIAKAIGATNFLYSQTIFPRGINTYRKFKLLKPNYEEVAGTGPNGYDRALNRSFWSDTTDGRLRTAFQALNSQETRQDNTISNLYSAINFSDGYGSGANRTGSGDPASGFDFGVEFVPYYYTLNVAVSGTSATNIPNNHKIAFTHNGIVANQINTMSGTLNEFGEPADGRAPFAILDAYQPYPISLLSKWPLEVRADIYDKPHYLTSTFGGNGLMIGLTPNSLSASLGGLGSSSYAARITATFGMVTRSAGELVYSTKPTLFFRQAPDTTIDFSSFASNVRTFVVNARRASPTNALDAVYAHPYPRGDYGGFKTNVKLLGYSHATASLQFHRHTFPYNTPFWATHKIIGRNPMYNSYEAFIGSELDTVFKEYSILPEFRIGDHLEYYDKLIQEYEKTPGAVFEAVKHEVQDNKLKLVRAAKADLFGFFSQKEIFKYHKLNFLKLDGADHTASSDLQTLKDLDPSTVNYEYDELAGAVAEPALDPSVPSALSNVQTYKRSQEAVNFYSKYSHTDRLINFSNLMAQNKSLFTNDDTTIPSKITFKCKAVKKLLPYDGFYPVTRTVQIGNYLKQAFGNDSILSSQPVSASNKTDMLSIDEKLQGLLEHLMAPGVFYNSIKSGIAVDYPVIQTDMNKHRDGLVTVEGTEGFVRGNVYYYLPVNTIDRRDGTIILGPETRFAALEYLGNSVSASYGYGGFSAIGAQPSVPGLLKKNFQHGFEQTLRPNSGRLTDSNIGNFSARLPFEYLRSVSSIKDFFKRGDGDYPILTHMFQDQVDLTRNSRESTTTQAQSASYKTMQSWNFFIKNSPLKSPQNFGQVAYENSVQNYLAECMNFFLDDIQPNVKMPILYSNLMEDDINLDIDKRYHAAITLYMGKDQVMCEGPRNAGMHISSSNEFGERDLALNYRFKEIRGGYYIDRKPSLRGYLYGGPCEVIDAGASIFNAVSSSGVVASKFSLINTDPEAYYAYNLQDPAYQAFTPPYFYGKSSLIFNFDPESSVTDLSSIFASCQATSGSLFEELYDLENRLAKTVPTTSSLSKKSANRMKIDASVDIFNPLVQFTNLTSGQRQKVWYITPKWVCPVLDFSSSFAAVEEVNYTNNPTLVSKEKVRKFKLVENIYHNETTGKSMWGGYGTDPYDFAAMNEIYAREGKTATEFEKGIYLSVDEALQKEKAKAALDIDLRSDLSTARSSIMDRQQSATDFTTGSMLSDLNIFDTQTVPIGKMAQSKEIHEAVAIIPYFERPLSFGLSSKASQTKLPELGGEVYETREIIPGKHFLPINKGVFENILSVMLTHILYDPGDPKYAQFFGSTLTDYTDAKATDCGRMISTLLGDPIRNNKPAYQLPPEFDFINNAAVDPFQIMIMPFSHKLSKQDLINIYQGIMPDISIRLQKVIEEVSVRPTAGVGNANLYPPIDLGPGLENVSLETFGLADFLSPAALNASKGPFGQLVADSRKIIELPNWTSRDFYKNLKFMTFKIKQKSVKNYDRYKKRQISLGLQAKFLDSNINSFELDMSSDHKKYLYQIFRDEVYGTNWPYDNFSLIEAIKMDIEIGVDE